MRLTREVILGERRITCRELLVGEVRDWLGELPQVTADLIGDDLWEGITLAELARLTDLKPLEADALAPSEVQAVVDACRECNPHFFGLRARLLARGQALAQSSMLLAAPSSAPATPTSGTTPTASS
jgi:hypothetical protein